MSAQISYTINQDVAYAGLIYAQSPHDIVSRLVSTAPGIAFGVAVSRGSNLATQIRVGGTLYLGITVRSLDKEGAANTGAIQWNVTESAAVIRTGYVWVVCTDGASAGDTVKYNDVTGVLGNNTVFPAGAGESVIDGAVWDQGGSIGELAILRLSA